MTMAIGTLYRPGYASVSPRRVEVDGWSAGSPGDIDNHGTVWHLGKVVGWQTAPGLRLSLTDRPAAHGSFDGPAYLDPRVVTITGTAIAVDYVSARRSRDVMTSVLGDPTMGLQTMTVYAREYTPMQAQVRRSDEAKTSERGKDGVTFDWSLIVVAPDPLRYSTSLQSPSVGLPNAGAGGLVFPLTFPLTFGAGAAGGDLPVTNNGTIATWPVLRITGPVTGPSITNLTTGQSLVFASTFSVPAGQTMTIDSRERLVDLVGIPRRGDLITAQWFQLITGDQTLRFTAVSSYDPAAQLVCEYREAWS